MALPSQGNVRTVATSVFVSNTIRVDIAAAVLPCVVLFASLLLGSWLVSVREHQNGVRVSLTLREAQKTIRLAMKAVRQRVDKAIREQERNKSMGHGPATQQFRELMGEYQDEMQKAVSLGFHGDRMDGKKLKNIGSFDRATTFSLTTISLIGALTSHLMKTGWTLLETLYSAFVTFSTIGFGDYVPTAANGHGEETGSDAFVMAAFVSMGMFLLTMSAVWMYGEGEEEEANAETETDDDESDLEFDSTDEDEAMLEPFQAE